MESKPVRDPSDPATTTNRPSDEHVIFTAVVVVVIVVVVVVFVVGSTEHVAVICSWSLLRDGSSLSSPVLAAADDVTVTRSIVVP